MAGRLYAGKIRIQRGGATVVEKAFRGGEPSLGDPGPDGRAAFFYNPDCKVEITPPDNGQYTAYLIDGGGNQISAPANFTVANEQNRTAIIEWVGNE